MKTLIASLLLSTLSFATIDSYIKVEFASFSLTGETRACSASTLALDGISSSIGNALNLALKTITNPQKIYTSDSIGMIDVNLLTQTDSEYDYEVIEDFENYGTVTVNLTIGEAGIDQINTLYYLITKNAFKLGAKKLFINVKGVEELKGVLFFPSSTRWPLTKTSPVIKTLNKKMESVIKDC